jgi:hypothetical protein
MAEMPQPVDTGGLGLLLLLQQAGLPPQILASLADALRRQGAFGPQPIPEEQNSGGGGPGGPGPAGTTTSGEGVPGVGPTDGTGTGLGPGATFGGSVNAAVTGARQGISGQLAQSLDLPSVAGKAAAVGAKAGATALGVPAAPLGLLDTIFGALKGLADQNLRLNGQRVGPMRFGGPAVVPDTPPPDIHFADPNEPVDMGPIPDIPEGEVTIGQITDANGNPVDAPPSLADVVSAAVAAAGDTGSGAPGIGGSGAGPGPGGAGDW